jgi:hypothetical protein
MEKVDMEPDMIAEGMNSTFRHFNQTNVDVLEQKEATQK